MDQVERRGNVVTVIRDAVKVQRTYARSDKALEAERRLQLSRAARDRFITRKSR